MKMLTKDVLKELLYYDKTTGNLYWKSRNESWFKSYGDFVRWNARLAFKPAFYSVDKDGYRQGRVLGTTYQTHRIIWFMTYGSWPNNIDHINGDKSDNRLENLRSVDTSENNKNKRPYRNNTTGRIGVYLNKTNNKWKVSIGSKQTYKFLGYYDDWDEACRVRTEAETTFNYHPNHGKNKELPID
jgi:hypothetical protein